MKRKYLISLLFVLFTFVTGCSNHSEKFFLDDNFYDSGEFIELTSDDFNNITGSNYILFTFNNFCAMAIPCEDIFKEFAKENNITFFSMKYDEFKKIRFHDVVRFAPSVILVKNGEIVSYLDTEKNEDLLRYQDVEEFTKWIGEYIYLSK